MTLFLQETATAADLFHPLAGKKKRNSRSLDLIPIHPTAAPTTGPIARSTSAVEIKILTQNIGNQSMPIQNTDGEASLSAVLPNTSSSASPTSPAASNMSPTSGSLLFNFGLSTKSCSPNSRKQSFCSSIIQKVSWSSNEQAAACSLNLLPTAFFYRSLQLNLAIMAVDQEEDHTFRHFQVLQERANLPQVVLIH